MELLPLHPKLVHLPLALAVLMPGLCLGLVLAWWRDWLPKRTWVLALLGQGVLLAGALAAVRTGESDEERAERVVPERALELHEQAADAFVWGSGVVLALAFLPVLLRNPRAARIAALTTAAGSAAVLVLGLRVGEAGGALVYRHGAADAFLTAPGGPVGTTYLPRADGDDDDR